MNGFLTENPFLTGSTVQGNPMNLTLTPAESKFLAANLAIWLASLKWGW